VATNSADVIGKGIRDPFSFSVGRGVKSVSTSNGTDKINDSIRTILQTRPGERMFEPEFGSRLYDLVFEPNDTLTNQLLYFYTVEALTRWERRIRITRVSFQKDDARPEYIGISIAYVILQTHVQGNYVFPFVRQGMSMSSAVTGVESKRIYTQGTVLPAGINPSSSQSR
jgi:phage baseplate assembly protein W